MQADSFVLMLLVEATLIFITAAVVAALLRNESASVSRGVWILTLTAAASLPVGMAATPAWRLKLIPAATSTSKIPDNPSARQNLGDAESRYDNASNVTVASQPASTVLTQAPAHFASS